MTALCGGGPSGPLATASVTLDLTVSAILAFLVPVVGDVAAGVLAPVILSAVNVEIGPFCATDPPADPGLNFSIVSDAISIPPTLTTFSSITKVADWFLHQYWFQICHCTTVTTPAAPTPSNPGPVDQNRGLPAGNPQPCWNVTLAWSAGALHSALPGNADLTLAGLPNGVPITTTWLSGSLGQELHAVPIDGRITAINLSVTVNEPFNTLTGVYYVQSGTLSSTATGAQLTGGQTDVQVLFGSGDPSTKSFSLPNGFFNKTQPHWWSLWVGNYDSVPHTGTLTLSFTCPPGVNYGNCCVSTDPALEGELQAILQYVQAIYAGLPIPPTSFAEATVHAGLTGNGSVTFADLPIALKVTLTTIPGWVGREIGSPNFYFDVGYLSFATSEGSYAQQRLELAEQLVTVPLLAGSVGYTLENGIVASITELTAGP